MLPIDPVARTVMNLMRTRGGAATIVIPDGEPTYNPETSTVIATETYYPVRVLVFDYIQKTQGATVQGSTLIQTGDKQMFVQPTDDLPEPKARTSRVVFKGVNYDVITVKALDPSGTNVLLYELFIRE